MKHEDSITVPEAVDPHRECWDLLPWLVTGRLSNAERAQVEAHLADCQACREELVAQRQLRERMSSEERVTYSHAASFEKLWSRIEELEREVPQPSTDDDGRPTTSSGTHRRARPYRDSQLSRWLVAAVIVQTLALTWLAVSLMPQTSGQEWPFRTVTSSLPASTTAPAIRVVFAKDVTLGELQTVLAAHGLVVVQGSPASEALLLLPVAGAATTDVTLVLERLRAHPRVRFAELAYGGSAR